MEKTNTGSTFFIETDDENRFKYFFMALGQCSRGFQNAMRPLILVDGTTIKARYEGKLIIATCQDVNIQIYPLAFGIIDGENDLAVRWFFMKLRVVIGDVEYLAFVTDWGQSIINGIVEIFPKAYHGYCMYHIQDNVKTKYRGSDIVALFRRAAKAYSFEEFDKFMVEIESKSHAAWEYLTKMGIEHWTRSHFPGRQYNMMTSNNAKSLNALFKKDRELPILAMIKHIRNKLQHWFNDRREEPQSCTSVLTPAHEDKLFKTLEVAERYVWNHWISFVFREMCTVCRSFIADYWRAEYAETIFHVPNEFEWEVVDHILLLNNLLPPDVRARTPGRRRTSKISSNGEFSQPRKCGRCGATGHTRRFCPSQIPLHNNATNVE